MQRASHRFTSSGDRESPEPGKKPAKSNGGTDSVLGRWQVFVPSGEPGCFWSARELADRLPFAFLVPVREAL